jgi:hypothetical protein
MGTAEGGARDGRYADVNDREAPLAAILEAPDDDGPPMGEPPEFKPLRGRFRS